MIPDPEEAAKKAEEAVREMGVNPFNLDLPLEGDLIEYDPDDFEDINRTLSEYDMAEDYD